MNSVYSLPCRVSWKRSFSHKCFLTVSSPKPEKSNVSMMVDKSVPHPWWGMNCQLQVARDTWLAKTWPPYICVPRRTSSCIFLSLFIAIQSMLVVTPDDECVLFLRDTVERALLGIVIRKGNQIMVLDNACLLQMCCASSYVIFSWVSGDMAVEKCLVAWLGKQATLYLDFWKVRLVVKRLFFPFPQWHALKTDASWHWRNSTSMKRKLISTMSFFDHMSWAVLMRPSAWQWPIQLGILG